jgi:hypothetical protein
MLPVLNIERMWERYACLKGHWTGKAVATAELNFLKLIPN